MSATWHALWWRRWRITRLTVGIIGSVTWLADRRVHGRAASSPGNQRDQLAARSVVVHDRLPLKAPAADSIIWLSRRLACTQARKTERAAVVFRSRRSDAREELSDVTAFNDNNERRAKHRQTRGGGGGRKLPTGAPRRGYWSAK